MNLELHLILGSHVLMMEQHQIDSFLLVVCLDLFCGEESTGRLVVADFTSLATIQGAQHNQGRNQISTQRV